MLIYVPNVQIDIYNFNYFTIEKIQEGYIILRIANTVQGQMFLTIIACQFIMKKYRIKCSENLASYWSHFRQLVVGILIENNLFYFNVILKIKLRSIHQIQDIILYLITIK